MTSQFDLTRFYDIIMHNSDFNLGFLTREFQIPTFPSLKTFSLFLESACILRNQ